MEGHYAKTWSRVRVIQFLLCFSLIYLPGLSLYAQQTPEDTPYIPVFDGTSAFTFLYKQVEFGPRVTGGEGRLKAQEAFIDWFKQCGGYVHEQEFIGEIGGDHVIAMSMIKGKNIIAYFGPKSDRSDIIIAASYDSTPICGPLDDYTLYPSPGANYNASGVSVILELARLFAIKPPDISVEFVLFDLSVQYFDPATEADRLDRGCEFYATNYLGKKPDVMIVLEGVGSQSLEIQMNNYCWKNYRELNERFFERAGELNLPAFDKSVGSRIDGRYPRPHRILINAGFPVCYLSDKDYSLFMSKDDEPAACSSTSLQQVGDLLVDMIYNLSIE